MLPEIMGYRRPDGRFGIRNHIAVIATMDNANPTVRRICSLVKGCVPFCPGFGRGEMNEDLALHNLLSINTALHPNVYGVINQGLTLDQATDIVQDKLVDVCWGAMTSSDMLGEIETAASRLLRTL